MHYCLPLTVSVNTETPKRCYILLFLEVSTLFHYFTQIHEIHNCFCHTLCYLLKWRSIWKCWCTHSLQKAWESKHCAYLMYGYDDFRNIIWQVGGWRILCFWLFKCDQKYSWEYVSSCLWPIGAKQITKISIFGRRQDAVWLVQSSILVKTQWR